MSASNYPAYFASSPRHLEPLLADELKAIGATDVRAVASGVQFNGNLATAYRACLWSRVANRVLYPVSAGAASSPEQLYSLIQTTDWSEHLRVEQTLAVDFFCANSQITHSQYGALKVKDAVVDQFRERVGERPSVDRNTPDVRINVYLFRNKARVAIDLSGASLHRRGYRLDGSRAPLKENLAAALLLAAGWPAMASAGKSFCDPMCGSGTLLIEAAMIASNTAPGLLREYYGFSGWRQHQPEVWQRVLDEARESAEQGRMTMPTIVGSDHSAQAVSITRDNIDQAGFTGKISVSCATINSLVLPPLKNPGLVLCNPPYGIRVEDQSGLGQLYSDIGTGLKRHFGGWRVALFSGAPKLLHRTRLPLQPVLLVDNGGIPCKLLAGEVPQTTQGNTASAVIWDDALNTRHSNRRDDQASGLPVMGGAMGADDNLIDNMFANRLQKNVRHLKSWVKREGITAYRVYDADMPEYAVAVDIYDSDQRYVVVQEYQAPSRVDENKAAQRLALVLESIPDVLDCPKTAVHLKTRKRQKGSDQYMKSSNAQNEHIVHEHSCQLLVNFEDYLDTGLFLDHRKIRRHIQSMAAGLRFLNLFSYTAAATVHAIKGGAITSLSVDMSNTYTDWAERNIALNHGDPLAHRLLRTDCTQWLTDTVQSRIETGDQFDLILLDPPTFSNSAKMGHDWDVQRDHRAAINQVMSLLAPAGLLIFSTNFRRFRIDQSGLTDYELVDRTSWSLDRDFQRNIRIHQCWFIRHR